MRQLNSLIALLILGITMCVGSLPFFFLHGVMVVPHQNFYVHGRDLAEVISPGSGKVYGGLFLLIGLTFIYLYFRASRPAEEGRSRHRLRGTPHSSPETKPGSRPVPGPLAPGITAPRPTRYRGFRRGR